MTKIPATYYRMSVYIVGFVASAIGSVPTVVFVDHKGQIGWDTPSYFTVLPHDPTFNIYGRDNTFTPPECPTAQTKTIA